MTGSPTDPTPSRDSTSSDAGGAAGSVPGSDDGSAAETVAHDAPLPGSSLERSHWWADAVVYQIYVRSFADGNGDGVGDLDGIRQRLDHVSALGVDAIWLNPCYPSPQRDHGYDVADYFGIHDEYGDLETFDALLAEAARRGLRVLMDLVPNHCSSEHEWFRAALAAEPGSPERARFYFRDGRPDGDDPHGAPPNNWTAAFGGSSWCRVGDSAQWYLATFTPHQPDFDHTNPDVLEMFDRVLRFWFDRGVEGFRVDAITPVGKHPDLPDQPPVPAGTPLLQVAWENEYNNYRPEGHVVWRSLRNTLDDYMADHPGRDLMMVAESYMAGRPDRLASYVHDAEFHQAFAFDLLLAAWSKESIERAIADSLSIVDTGSPACWALDNHDVQRVVTRLGREGADDPDRATDNPLEPLSTPVDIALGTRRAAAAVALAMAMPGSIYLYMGEELGLPEVLDVPDDRREDPVFAQSDGERIGRDGCRIPLPWVDEERSNFGFSTIGDDVERAPEPWLPQPEWWGEFAVHDLDADDESMLTLYRDLVEVRRVHAVPQGHAARLLDLAPGLVAVRRGELVVVTNVTSTAIALDADGVGDELGAATPVFASSPGEMHTPGVIPPDCTVWLTR